MSKIIKQDTQGTKPLLQAGELGYDNYVAGGDVGRVYVGTGSANVALAKKAEVTTVDGKVDTHIARVDNPHVVTKAQVGLGSVDNTADSVKNVLSASKLTTARTINGVVFDGTANITVIDSTKLPIGGKAADSNLLDGMDPSSSNVGSTIVARDASGNFSAGIMTGTATKADKWTTPRTITLDGAVSGTVSIDGSQNVSITTSLNMDNLDYVNARDYFIIGEADDTGSIQRALQTGRNVKLDGTFIISSGGFNVGVGGISQLVFGTNPRADKIKVNFNDSTNIFNIMSDYSSVYGLGFEMVSGMKTGGAYVSLGLATRGNVISNFRMQHCFTGIKIDAEAVVTTINQGEILDSTSLVGMGIYINGGNDTFISQVVMDSGGVEPLAGIRIKRTQAVFISDVDIIDFGNPLLIDPDNGVSDLVTWCFFNSLACDTSSGHGIKIAPTGGVTVKGLFFDNCWSASNDLCGAYITATGGATVDGVFFTDSGLIQNTNEGLFVEGNVANVEFNSGRVTGNGRGNNSKAGIRFASTVNGFAVRGSRIGATMGMPVSQTYGIYVEGTPNNFIISDNNLTGNITDGLSVNITAGTNSSIIGNIGTTVTNSFNSFKMWHQGNDGTGSGLDADLLNGSDGSFYLKSKTIGDGDVNSILTSGMYRLGAATNSPIGGYGNILSIRGISNQATLADTMGQIAFDYDTGEHYIRGGQIGNSGGTHYLPTVAWGKILTGITPLGYTSGAGVGGVAVQGSFKTDTVYLNKLTGEITTSNSALAGNTVVYFFVSNSYVSAGDLVVPTLVSGTDNTKYNVWASIEAGGGGFYIIIKNITSTSYSEAIKIKFSVFKGANS